MTSTWGGLVHLGGSGEQLLYMVNLLACIRAHYILAIGATSTVHESSSKGNGSVKWERLQ